LPPRSNREIDFARRCLSDTGFFARELLGYTYDEDGEGNRINIGTGGIQSVGKTKEILDLLDNEQVKRKYIKAPRGCRKSTLAQAFCARVIVKNPDIRIIYVARTDMMSREKSIAIRNQLLRPEVQDLFGPQQGTPWDQTCWTVAGRENVGLQNATFRAFSQDSMPTGGRANIVVADDFIDASNCTNPEQKRKTRAKWAELMPFVAPGGYLIVFCTTWDDDDLNAGLEASKLFVPPLGEQIICGAGVHIVWRDGQPDIEEDETGLTFPHLTMEHLREKFHAMSLQGDMRVFCQQYLNQNTISSEFGFKREHFKSLVFHEDMRSLSGYLLTDTAYSMDPGSCYSVVAYCGLDAADNIYLLDLRVGHWDEMRFTDEFFEVLELWQGRVNHCGECWENVALATSYRGHLMSDSRARRTRLRTIEMKRPSSSVKEGRIRRLLPKMQKGEFYVVNSVPRTFQDVDGEKILFDRTGHWDGTSQTWKPGGELVEEFIRESTKKDIPDALAMLLEYEQVRRGQHRRMCSYKPYRPSGVTPLTATAEEAYSFVDERRNPAYPNYDADYRPGGHPFGGSSAGPGSGTDWWERTISGF